MTKDLSLAYKTTVKFPPEKHYESIDLLSSDVSEVTLDNYPNLQRIRISKCYHLTKVHLSNMPNLQVVDLLDNGGLQRVTFTKCPSIITVDAGFNTGLVEINGIDDVEYLSVPYCQSLKLQPLKKLVFLDASRLELNAVDFIKHCPNLECLVCTHNTTLKLSDVTKSTSLQILHLSGTKLNCDSVHNNSPLKIIIFDNCQNYEYLIKGDKNLLNQFYVCDSINANQSLKNFTKFDQFVPTYQKYQKMLYGPWGVPDIDLQEPVKVKSPIMTPPNGTNIAKAADSIIGSIMASAALDMVGVGVEFINDSVSKALLLGGMSITWSHPRCNRHNERFVRGTPTDDTSQSILIMRSIVESNNGENDDEDDQKDDVDDDDEENYSGKNLSLPIKVKGVRIDARIFGQKLIDWIEHGHSEHRHHGGLGCGSTTFQVVSDMKYPSDPISASRDVWIRGGKRAAPNGSVMRIASSGCFCFWEEEVVIKTAELYAKVTHADPRCVFCSIAAALLIARFIQWNAGLLNEMPDIDKAILKAKSLVPKINEYESDVDFYCFKCKTVDELQLSGDNKIGYCLKAFGSGVWALRYCNSIEEGLVKVLREGGDSDTNGAVVGALLGAKFGFESMPKDLVDLMFVGQWMFREMTPYMELMGIDMIQSPYLKK